MARFSGNVGFAIRTQTIPGVWSNNIVERAYVGSIVRETLTQVKSDKVNDDIRLEERISIVADAFAFDNALKIKYVERAGVRWSVVSIETKYPRLILSLGGAYHGKLPSATP